MPSRYWLLIGGRVDRRAMVAPWHAFAVCSMLACGGAVAGALAQQTQGPSTVEDFFEPGTQDLTLEHGLTSSGQCRQCHEYDDDGNPLEVVGPYNNWATSMMAQAARHPIWHAPLAIANQAARLTEHVTLLGPQTMEDVWRELSCGDVLVHTGIVAATGDRDGLPNVVPEAMAAGAIVVTTPGEGVLEAITHEVTGLVCAIDDAAAWQNAFSRVQRDDALVLELQRNARRWAEENFDAAKNAAKILERFGRSVP